jgi:hypothetical protein
MQPLGRTVTRGELRVRGAHATGAGERPVGR